MQLSAWCTASWPCDMHCENRWMALLAGSGVANFSVLGLADIPMYLTPFASLILTSVIIPRASFLGHLSGILVGYNVSRLFNALSLPHPDTSGSKASRRKHSTL